MIKVDYTKTIYRVVRNGKIFLTNNISDLTENELISLKIKWQKKKHQIS